MGVKMFGLGRKPSKEDSFPSPPAPPGPDAPASRYRSFVERYMIERVKFWPKTMDPREAAWLTVNEATTIYNMIRRADETYGKT